MNRLLITPLLLSHTPVRIVVHDGPEIVVCPTILVAPVTLWFIRLMKPALATGSARILSRLVPSVPINSTWVGVADSWVISALALRTRALLAEALRANAAAVPVRRGGQQRQ